MMKKIGLIISLLFVLQYAEAQTVAVPDTNLLRFFKMRYPSVIDANNKLIKSEAAKIRGYMYGNGLKVRSLEGIQYFTQVEMLDFGTNQITFLPELTSDSLKGIVLNNNQLESIPSLSKLTKLQELDLADNHLKTLPNLNSQSKLEKLICKGNLLTDLPPLDSLKNLVAFDISYNQLSVFPKLPVNNKIQTLHLNNNRLSTIGEGLIFSQLQKLFLYDNPLSFRELLKLTTIPRYDTVLVLRRNIALSVGKSWVWNENGAHKITTGIDVGVNLVSRDWFKNGTFLRTTTKDSLAFEKLALSDSGKYTCILRHAYFPNFEIQTDTFYVKVKSCFEASKLRFSTTTISCNKTGSLTITNPVSDLNYILKSTNSGSLSLSKSGFFAGLSEPSYSLIVRNISGCETIYPTEIKVPKDECRQVLITPNGDGESESFYFTQTGFVKIYDKRNELVKTLSIPGEWDASSSNGKVSTGYYVADINNGEAVLTISVVY